MKDSSGNSLKSNTITITVNTVPVPVGSYYIVYSTTDTGTLELSDCTELIKNGNYIMFYVYSDGTAKMKFVRDGQTDMITDYVFKGNDLYMKGTVKVDYSYDDGLLNMIIPTTDSYMGLIFSKLSDD